MAQYNDLMFVGGTCEEKVVYCFVSIFAYRANGRVSTVNGKKRLVEQGMTGM